MNPAIQWQQLPLILGHIYLGQLSQSLGLTFPHSSTHAISQMARYGTISRSENFRSPWLISQAQQLWPDPTLY